MKLKGFFLLFLIPALTACVESPEMTVGPVNGKEKPTVLTIPSGHPFSEEGNLLFQGEIVSQGKSEITERGFYWSVVSNVPGINGIYDSIIEPYFKTGVFTCELKNTAGEKMYYWRAYAKNSFGLDYGKVDSCQTSKDKPTVSTLLTINPHDDGILLFEGKVDDAGRSGIIEKGFFWSTVSNEPDSHDNKIVSDATTDVFNCELKNASGEKTYFWRAFARNTFDYDYGEIRSCSTPEIRKEENIFPTDSRGKGAVFLLNNSIYITCGEKDGGRVPVEDVWEYNTERHLWNQADSISFPGESRNYPVVFTIENHAFVGTGSQAYAQAFKDFFQFNAVSKKWVEVDTPDDFEARYQATAFSLNGKGYVIGGLTANNARLSNVWQYNSSNGSWVKKNDFPVDFYGGISIQGNNRAFVGFSEIPEYARILWEYDEANDDWIEFATLPDEVRTKIYSGVIVQNTIYIIDKNNVIWTCDMSDEIKTWNQKTDWPSLTFLNDREEILNQMLFTTGNSNSIYVGLEFTKALYEYRPLWDN